jgi:hypothetical protein
MAKIRRHFILVLVVLGVENSLSSSKMDAHSEQNPVLFYVNLKDLNELIKMVDKIDRNKWSLTNKLDSMHELANFEINKAKERGKTLEDLIIEKPNFQDASNLLKLIQPYVNTERFYKFVRLFREKYWRADYENNYHVDLQENSFVEKTVS